MSRSKRLVGSLTRPRSVGPPEGGSTPQVHLLQPLVFLFLFADVVAYHGFVAAHGRDEVPSGPEVLSHEVALPFAIDPGQVDRALAFDEANHLRHRILRRDRD